MAKYYGIVRTDEYLAHYGVKGMKWGVQKAKETHDAKKLKKHFNKSMRKLSSLYDKADLMQQRANRRSNAQFAGTGLGTAMINAGLGAINKHTKRQGYENYVANAGVAIGGLMGVGGGIAALRNNHRLGMKGHQKAVNNVNNWQNEMHKAFKGTKYEKQIPKKKYNDTYRLMDYNKIKNGSPTEIARIQGSHLTRNYKGKDKDEFISKLGSSNLVSIRSPRSVNTSFNGWETNYEGYSGKKKRK